MPIGVCPTLLARILTTEACLAKMLFLCRREFPRSNQLMHSIQVTSNRAILAFATGWSIMLSLVTYNDHLPYMTSAQQWVINITGGIWLLCVVLLLFVGVATRAM